MFVLQCQCADLITTRPTNLSFLIISSRRRTMRKDNQPASHLASTQTIKVLCCDVALQITGGRRENQLSFRLSSIQAETIADMSNNGRHRQQSETFPSVSFFLGGTLIKNEPHINQEILRAPSFRSDSKRGTLFDLFLSTTIAI